MPMTLEQLQTVRDELERLDWKIVELMSAEKVAREEEERNKDQRRSPWHVPKPVDGSAWSSAVRRASMDVTRALAELRRPS